jgi:hypothetical protein
VVLGFFPLGKGGAFLVPEVGWMSFPLLGLGCIIGAGIFIGKGKVSPVPRLGLINGTVFLIRNGGDCQV